MKAERVEPEREFVPVIITLESQEEVDSLFAIVNHTRVCHVLPALDSWYSEIVQFASDWKTRHKLVN